MSEKTPKRKNERIKAMRLKNGYTLAELSKKVGVSDATLQRYESGEIQNIKLSTISKLAKVFGCKESYLIGWDSDEEESRDDVLSLGLDNVFKPQLREIPILGEIACGKPLFCREMYDEYTLVADTKADFCLIANGDSMINARIYDGDVVLIKEQCEVENGEIAAVIIDDEATLKRVYKVGDVITLVSANPKYPPMVYTAEEFKNIRILGKAIGMQTNNLYVEKE